MKGPLHLKGPWQSLHPGDEADFYTLYCTQPVVIKNLSFLGSLEMENPKINPKSHLNVKVHFLGVSSVKTPKLKLPG